MNQLLQDLWRPGRKATMDLIAANVVIYVVVAILSGFIPGLVRGWLALSLDNLLSLKVWTLVTWAFVHDLGGLGHLLINMLMLFLFAPRIEGTEGRRKLWLVYGASIVASAVAVVGVDAASTVLSGPFPRYTVGASGAVGGIFLYACARRWNDVANWLFLGPMRYSTIAYVFIGIELLRILTNDGVSWAAHLGGYAMGAAAGFGWVNLDKLPLFRPRAAKPTKPRESAWERTRRERFERAKREGRTFDVIEGGKNRRDGDDDDDTIWH